VARMDAIPGARVQEARARAQEAEGMHQDSFDKGLTVRREVLGSEYVDRSIANATDFTRPLQELVTEYCWGEIWTREELPRKTRSFLNLAMITALNRPHELELHVRGAINNGLTVAEIREVFLQAAVYCGVPAALDSFRVAAKVFDEMGVDVAGS
jgi:4-carboxymuconolactone decarboxylase